MTRRSTDRYVPTYRSALRGYLILDTDTGETLEFPPVPDYETARSLAYAIETESYYS